MDIKEKLHTHCLKLMEDKILSHQAALNSIEESRNNETKSSAGDKYETSRAMLHIEEEKMRGQLGKTRELKLLLEKINPHDKFEEVTLGCLLIAAQGKYFISVPIGKVVLESETYFCISMASPIGKQLRGKKKGEEISFGDRKIKILDIL